MERTREREREGGGGLRKNINPTLHCTLLVLN